MRKYNKKKKRDKVIIPVVLHKLNSTTPFVQGTIDYKNVAILRKYINVEGKILSKKVTRLSAKHQRKMSTAIKTARVLGLLPFINQ